MCPFPSFEAFAQYADKYLDNREVAHIDAPETEEPTTMDAVWMPYDEANPAQLCFASEHRNISGTHEILVQWAMLTEEQRQKAKDSQ